MIIPLAGGRLRQTRIPRAARVMRACHDECVPASAEVFANSSLLAGGETAVEAAVMAAALSQARAAGGRYVVRDQESADAGVASSWCMICAQAIEVDDRVAIISI